MMRKATTIEIKPKSREILEKITRQSKCPQCIAKRAKIILMASDNTTNNEIAEKVEMNRGTVRRWRNKWVEKALKIKEAEEQNLEDKEFTEIIIENLSDEYRSGCPATFSPEQIVQIVGIALEKPADSGLPITNWSETAVAKEAVKRNIVENISQRSVGRFLKKRQK
jgi:putative transposase